MAIYHSGRVVHVASYTTIIIHEKLALLANCTSYTCIHVRSSIKGYITALYYEVTTSILPHLGLVMTCGTELYVANVAMCTCG